MFILSSDTSPPHRPPYRSLFQRHEDDVRATSELAVPSLWGILVIPWDPMALSEPEAGVVVSQELVEAIESLCAVLDSALHRGASLAGAREGEYGDEVAFPVTGQTYPRKLDTKLAEALAGIGATAHWIGTNIRLMSGAKELDEPFQKKQVGSSAMAYKRNPMRSERMCGLARKLIGLTADFHATHVNQWLERTLDDSAIRRMDIPQAYLLTDAILGLLIDISSGLVVNEAPIRRRLNEELPFMATEEILMAAVEKGTSRQTVHEVIREHAQDAARGVKMEGRPNDLLDRLAADERLPLGADELAAIAGDPARFVGRAEAQVSAFLEAYVRPVLAKWRDLLKEEPLSRVRV